MNFKELKIVVKQIKDTIKCQTCKKRYTDESIEVLGTPDGTQYYFAALCSKCKTDSMIHATLENELKPPPGLPKNLEKLGSSPRIGQISQNEVLDMHNFLKAFDGNFEAIFKKR
jgi:hypothetical protein